MSLGRISIPAKGWGCPVTRTTWTTQWMRFTGPGEEVLMPGDRVARAVRRAGSRVLVAPFAGREGAYSGPTRS